MLHHRDISKIEGERNEEERNEEFESMPSDPNVKRQLNLELQILADNK